MASLGEEDGVDIAAKKAKLILDCMMTEDADDAKHQVSRPKAPYPHVALRWSLVLALKRKDPRNALVRAMCAGPLHDPSIAMKIEHRLLAGKFHVELQYWELVHPWKDPASKQPQRRVPMMVHYTLVQIGLGTRWRPRFNQGAFRLMRFLRSMFTVEEWDAFVFSLISLNWVSTYEAAPMLFWLHDNRTIDSALDLLVGHHLLMVIFKSNVCNCEGIPKNPVIRVNAALPRLQRIVKVYKTREPLLTQNCAALGCLMKAPFCDTVLDLIDWKNANPTELHTFAWHVVERKRLNEEILRRKK